VSCGHRQDARTFNQTEFTMLMTKELEAAIDQKLLAMVPDADAFSEDDAWDCFIDTLQECETRLSQIDEVLLFQKYLDWTFLNIH